MDRTANGEVDFTIRHTAFIGILREIGLICRDDIYAPDS